MKTFDITIKCLALKCYVCGEKVEGEFNVFSLSEETDRVFIVDKKCTPRVGDALTLPVKVQETQS